MQMITSLDVRTMFVVMGATILISGISMMCYAINRKIYGGFGLWTAGLLSGATGFFLISFRHILSDIITIILANALVYLSVSLIYLGFAAMAEKKINFGFHLSIMAVLSFAVNPFFTYVIANVPARICLISFTVAVYFALDARMVMFQIKDSHFRQNVLLCITLILIAALSGFRGVYYLLPQHAITDYMINVPAQGIFLLLITLLHISLVMGLMQLNAQILERELFQEQARLKKSEEKYRHLFATAPAGIYEIDFEKMKIINVNDIMCRYSGYTEKEILTMNPSDLLDKDGQKNFAGRIKFLKAGHKIPKTVEFNIVKKNGEALPVLLSSDFIHEENHLKGAVVVVHDITERKKMEQDKIQAHKEASEQKKLALIGQVAGKMAHDFNNILGIIMGNIELMLLDCENSAMTKTLELILNQTMRGKSMTRNLVAFARTQEPRQSYFNIAGKIDVVLALMKKDLEGIQVIKKYQPHMPDLLADPDMVEHALVNLLQNAVHALGRTKKPMITLSTQHLEDTICIKIMDNGCGIPREHLEKIYDPAFTLKGGNDTSGAYPSHVKGTGYGMGNVQKYVHQHKGSVQVTSSINAGTTVTITFPVIEKPLTSWEKKEILKPPIHNGRHILLVEDEQDIFHVQYRILTQSPFHHRVDVAHSGQTAMELFDNNSYDLVSLDYMLPGEYNGMAVYHHIRQQNSNIPVLFISGNIEFLESIKTLKDQDHRLEHLSKPCKNKAYVEGINALLDKNCGHVHGS